MKAKCPGGGPLLEARADGQHEWFSPGNGDPLRCERCGLLAEEANELTWMAMLVDALFASLKRAELHYLLEVLERGDGTILAGGLRAIVAAADREPRESGNQVSETDPTPRRVPRRRGPTRGGR